LQIVPGVHQIPVAAWSRVYLIEGDGLVLVDSGFPWSPRRVLDYIRSIGRSPRDLTHILMTHSHPDHTSGAFQLARVTRAAVVAHRGDARMHADGHASLSYMGVFGSVKAPIPFFRHTPVGLLVEDGQQLSTSFQIEALHTPGHTPGSTCYLLRDRGILFTGDTLFSDGRRLSRSLPMPGTDRRHYRASVERLAGLDFDILCGGHGAPLVGGASTAVRRLVEHSPEPPTWGGFFRSMPGRLINGGTLRGG
jgi:glyoxylase-like metal-dependent hydrolase (beta-lactamase superfamily II)